MHFHIFILFRFLCNKQCSKVIFRVLDEKPTHKHVLWRQMTEIGNLTSWPQMTLTSEKVTPGWGRCSDMSQTRIMSIHRLLMRLFPAFCGGKALNGNVKHFVFDLTCNVTGDPEVKFLNFIWKISSRPFHCRLNFPPTSVGFRDRWGAATAPPPPPPAEGRVRTRPSRARVKIW